MYRSWFDGIYQRKNLIQGRLEYKNGDEVAMSLTEYSIGDDVTVHVKDGITGVGYEFPATVVAIRFSAEVWYDLVVWPNRESLIGYRVNRIRGENISNHKSLPHLEAKIQASIPLLMLSNEADSEDLDDVAPGMPEDEPVSYFGKQLFIGRIRKQSVRISRLFLVGSLTAVDNQYTIGDSVVIRDDQPDGPGFLCGGVISEIRVEDEFYYSVAVPTYGHDTHAVIHGLHSSCIEPTYR